MKAFLALLILVTFAYADSDQNYFLEKEKDFRKIQDAKKTKNSGRSTQVDALIQKKENIERQRDQARQAYVDKKRNDRAPASTLEDEFYEKRYMARVKNLQSRQRYIEQKNLKDLSRENARKAFDSKEVRIRENKPWRLN